MAGIRPQTIGKEMPYGFAGCYARQPDMIANTVICANPCSDDASPRIFGNWPITSTVRIGISSEMPKV